MRKKVGEGGMEKYENLGLVGEGSYGMVLKCRHKESGQLVAIKKFLESEDDKMVKKIAMREVKMLKQLRHDHLVNLIEVFRRKKRLYLVFEFVDHTVLDELEKCPNGLDENTCRKIIWQVLKGTEFCHLHHIIHRDIKPENILVSKMGIVKICDFGFARTLAQPGETYTDYVATRWYRAPELLVGDTKYGQAVDIWAIGCLLSEMLTGEPLFPGDSDIDQLYHIVKCFGNLTPHHREVFLHNPLFVGMRIPEVREVQPLDRKFTKVSPEALDFMKQCLRLDPDNRPTCTDLLKHGLFTRDGFAGRYVAELKQRIQKENLNNPLYKAMSSNLDGASETDNPESEGTSKNSSEGHMGGAGAKAGAPVKKKSKNSKESTSFNSLKKESTTLSKDTLRQQDTDSMSQKKRVSVMGVSGGEGIEKQTPTKKTSPSLTNGTSVTLPPAVSHALGKEGEVGERNEERRNQQQLATSSTSPQLASIPPIHQSGVLYGSRPTQGKGSDKLCLPSIGNSPSSHLAFSSFAHNLPSSSNMHQYRVSPDKVMSKKGLVKKGSTVASSTSTSYPYGSNPHMTLHSSMHILEKNKRSQQGLSLPEVRRASEVLNKGKKDVPLPKKASVATTIPHIAHLEFNSTNNSQDENISDRNENGEPSPGLPSV